MEQKSCASFKKLTKEMLTAPVKSSKSNCFPLDEKTKTLKILLIQTSNAFEDSIVLDLDLLKLKYIVQ